MQVAGMLDVPSDQRLAHELVAEVPGLDEQWIMGAIVGPSGSGKTTLARQAFHAIDQPRPWPNDRAIVDVLGEEGGGRVGEGEGGSDADGTRSAPTTIKDITRTLVGVGLGSVPTWLKPYRVLSGGERFRADLARAILSRAEQCSVPPRAQCVVVIDEFTSTLDRNSAQTTAMAVARLMRTNQQSNARHSPSAGPAPRLVLITCHTDVLPWLAPDWVIELDPIAAPRLVYRPFPPPHFDLVVQRVPQSLWRGFAAQHYLAHGLAASATCYAAILKGSAFEVQDLAKKQKPALSCPPSPVAFCAVAATLGWKKSKHIARLVTLPEFQGLGIGGRLLDEVARRESQRGTRITITASHPAILAHCSNSPRWQFVEVKKTGSTRQRYQGREVRCSAGRAVASFRYTGG